MNYRYHVDKKEYVLSEEEHLQVQEAIKDGIMLVYLRNNTLAINPSFIRSLDQTTDPTPMQEAERDAVLRISPPDFISKVTPERIAKFREWLETKKEGVGKRMA